MERVRQSFSQIVESLIPIEAIWLDEHAEKVIITLQSLPKKSSYAVEDLRTLLDQQVDAGDFDIALTVLRLFLELSKDEFTIRIKGVLAGGTGINRYRTDKELYLEGLVKLGVLDAMQASVNRSLSWFDLLIERLKVGRGSAIKGQQRGREMEDFVETIISRVFPKDEVAVRCRFVGANGQSTEKTDFAIPNAHDPLILIEVKAYGATGSKQTDVLGDISRIVAEKRDDTVFFLVTDGITWKERASDLKKLIALQHAGKIRKIYTKSMADELEEDLKSLKNEFRL